jgi:hypothetical protein
MYVIKYKRDFLSEESILNSSASLAIFGSVGVHQRAVGRVIASTQALARPPFLDLFPMDIIIPLKSFDRV